MTAVRTSFGREKPGMDWPMSDAQNGVRSMRKMRRRAWSVVEAAVRLRPHKSESQATSTRARLATDENAAETSIQMVMRSGLSCPDAEMDGKRSAYHDVEDFLFRGLLIFFGVLLLSRTAQSEPESSFRLASRSRPR